MTRKSRIALALGFFLAAGVSVQADTFKNKATGEVFYGFRTTKVSGAKTLVYNDADKKLSPIDLGEYEVVMDEKGRRNSVVQIAITDPEILLSTNIAQTISEAIVKAANTGPRFVLLKIDNPGGRGENMKEICSTIIKTNTCPIVAYISGGTYGGAHSAAAGIAIACDKIYVSPTASMSAVGPFVVDSSGQSDAGFVKTYSPDSLASYSIYLSTLAEAKHRSGMLAKAFLDKKLSLVEVTDTDGKTSIVEKSLRQPTQTVVKTLCEGSQAESQTSQESNEAISPETAASTIHGKVLNLSSSETLRLKLVDAMADTIQAVMADMGVADASIANAPGIDSMVKKFVAAKRNVGQSLVRINFLENRAATLEDQINTLEQQLRTNPVTRSNTREEVIPSRRQRRTTTSSNDYNYYYGQQYGTGIAPSVVEQSQTPIENSYTSSSGSSPTTSGQRSNSRRNVRASQSETIVANEAPAAASQTKQELYSVLNELVGEYQRTIAVAKRWGGVLPPELSVQSLQNNMDSAVALANSLNYR